MERRTGRRRDGEDALSGAPADVVEQGAEGEGEHGMEEDGDRQDDEEIWQDRRG